MISGTNNPCCFFKTKVLAQVALEAGIIDGRVFVALVFMAIVTSIIPGPLLRFILKRPSTISVMSIIPSKAFFPKMLEGSMQETIQQMATALDHPEASGPAIEKELAKNEPCYDGLAVASVLSKNIKYPVASLAIFRQGVHWNPRLLDESMAKFVVLLIVPETTHTMEFDLMREVSQLFSSHLFQEELLNVRSHVELQALFQIEKYRQGMAGHNPNPTPVIAVKETGMIAVDVNDILDHSPRMEPGSPETILSPRVVAAMQAHNLELNEEQAATQDENLDGPMGDLARKRPVRRESKSIRETIEEYVMATPGLDPVPETSEVLRRLSQLDKLPVQPSFNIDQPQSEGDIESGMGTRRSSGGSSTQKADETPASKSQASDSTLLPPPPVASETAPAAGSETPSPPSGSSASSSDEQSGQGGGAGAPTGLSLI